MARVWACVSFSVGLMLVGGPLACSWQASVVESLKNSPRSSRQEVIERSKKAQPTWLSLVPERLLWQGRFIRFVIVKHHLAEIRLGVIQAQSYAREAFMRELHLYTLELALLQTQTTLSVTQRSLLQQMVSKVLAENLAKNIAVADLYFEKIYQRSLDRDDTYYEAYVLAIVPFEVWQHCKDSLRAKLKAHHLPIFRQLASRL